MAEGYAASQPGIPASSEGLWVKSGNVLVMASEDRPEGGGGLRTPQACSLPVTCFFSWSRRTSRVLLGQRSWHTVAPQEGAVGIEVGTGTESSTQGEGRLFAEYLLCAGTSPSLYTDSRGEPSSCPLASKLAQQPV